MTDQDFIELAKESTVFVLKEKHDIEIENQDDLQLVWFNHTLGNKKCLIWGQSMNDYYSEVTFNNETFDVYVDIYLKQSDTLIGYEDEGNI